MSVGGFTLYGQLRSFSWRKHVWTYSVLVENKFGLFQSLGNKASRSGSRNDYTSPTSSLGGRKMELGLVQGA